MGLLEQYNLRANGDFFRRVVAAFENTANAVFAEDAATPNHDKRLAAAKKIFASERLIQETFPRLCQIPAVINNAGNINVMTDVQLQAVVSTVFDRITSE